jgi:hypothetical protein
MIPPLENIKFWSWVGIGTCVVSFCLSSSYHLDNSPSDIDAAQATEASLNDALEQAQAERPELWTAEQKQRARVAAQIVAGRDER